MPASKGKNTRPEAKENALLNWQPISTLIQPQLTQMLVLIVAQIACTLATASPHSNDHHEEHSDAHGEESARQQCGYRQYGEAHASICKEQKGATCNSMEVKKSEWLELEWGMCWLFQKEKTSRNLWPIDNLCIHTLGKEQLAYC